RKALEAQYARLADAVEKRDHAAFQALRTDDFNTVDEKGRKHTAQQMSDRAKAMLARIQPPIKTTNTIQKIQVKGNDAIATVRQYFSRMQPLAGKLRKLETYVTQEETWIETQVGWKLRFVDGVRDGETYVDGKRIDPSKPYDPDAPSFEPKGEGAEAPGTLAQEYQKALKESGQISPSFRDAKTDEERKQAVEATDKFARRFVILAEKYPNDPLAIEVLTQAVRVMNGVDSAIQMSWVTNQTAFPTRSMDDSTELAMTLLLRHHIKSDKLGTACERMRYGTRKEYETFLRKVIKESPHKDVQGIACLSLAQFLNSHSLKFDLFQDRPELAERYEAILGKGYYEELRRKGRDGRTKEVEALLEQAEAKYGEVKMPWSGRVGAKAKAELFLIRHFGVGKQAEDIDGKDQDGKPFKLSDYRGKVVLLYFWSEY